MSFPRIQHSRTGRLKHVVLFTLLSLVLFGGCTQVVLLGYLIAGKPSIEPDFETQTAQCMTDKGVTVAIVCYADKELQINSSATHIDKEIAKYVTYKMRAMKISVVDPDHVHAWLDKHPDWNSPTEIGEAFETTYVVYIDMSNFSLYEEDSAHLYRGRAEAVVSVYEMDPDGEGEKIYSKDLTSVYPTAVARDTAEVSYYNFRGEYLTRLAEEIGRLFYPYYNGDDMPFTM